MGFFDIDRWSEIWQTISRNRRRSIMTAMGVFWGIFMLTALLGIGMGLGRLFRAQLGEMSSNTLLMSASTTSIPYKGMASSRSWNLENGDVDALRKLDDILYSTGVIWAGDKHCSYNERKGEYTLMGYAPDFQRINPQKIMFGRYINDVDIERKRKVCVIGTQVWKDLFPGGEDPSGKVIKMNGSYFTVVGVIARLGNMFTFSDIERTVILPTSLLQQMIGMGNKIHMLAVSGHTDVASKALEEQCREVVYARHIIAPGDEKAMWAMSTAMFLDKVNGLFWGISLLTWIVGLGTLLAGIVGVSNIMLVLVKERTQEIGIRRALGAPPRAILTQILSESFVLTFIAGVLGLTAAVGALSLWDSIYNTMIADANGSAAVSWQISFGMGMLSLTILVTGSLLAGVIPAARALRIKAVDAIREE